VNLKVTLSTFRMVAITVLAMLFTAVILMAFYFGAAAVQAHQHDNLQSPYFDIALDEARQLVYGSQRAAGQIDVIDMNTLAVLNSVPLGASSQPTGLEVSPDGSELAVALYGAGKIAFIDLSAQTVLTTVVPQGTSGPNRPFDLLYGRPGRLYSVGSPDSTGLDFVHVFDTASHTEVGRSSEIMRAGPRLAMTGDQNTLYVSEVNFSPQKIYRFDITGDTPFQTAQAPHGPVAVNTLAVRPDGSQVYSCYGQVWSADLTTQIGSFLPIGDIIEYSAVLDRFFVVENYPIVDSPSDIVVEFDAVSYLPLRSHQLASDGGPARVDAAGTTLYVSTDLGIEAVALDTPSNPPASLAISGPITGETGLAHSFTATVAPPTTTTPIIYSWQATDQPTLLHAGGLTNTVTFSWLGTGPKTITVTATNVSGHVVTATHLITMTGPPVPAPVRYFDIVVDEARQVIYGTDSNAGLIHVTDMSSMAVIGSIPVGIGTLPAGLDISPDGMELAVALSGSGEIAFIDLAASVVITKVVPQVTIGPNVPYDLLYGRPGRLYSSGNPKGSGFDYIHVFDTASHAEIGRSSEIMRAGPRLAMTGDQNTLYVSEVNVSPEQIYRFDITSDQPVQTAQGPHGPVTVNTLAVRPDGSQVYSSRGQVWSGDLTTQLGSFTPGGEEIEYLALGNRFFVSAGPQLVEFDGSTYLARHVYPLPGPAGPARSDAAGNVLYVSTDTGIEAITLVPGPDFSGSPLSGMVPLTVDFTNQSIGQIDSCSWDFGDGSGSNDCADQSHEYLSAGIFTVSLTVSGPGGTDTLTRTDYITVYEPVTAAFTANPTSGYVPLLVDFANLSTGDFDSCLWEFGDGQSSADCDDPSHLYAAAGVYTVTLTITGPGGIDTAVRVDYIVVELYRIFLPVVMAIPQ
jgi:hypothetical protein